MKYKPIFSLPVAYIKVKDPVYEGFENFSFKQNNYEIMQKDIRFLENSKQSGQLNLTQQDFEKVIDVFEKMVFMGEQQSRDNLVARFKEYCPEEFASKITKENLEFIYQKVSETSFLLHYSIGKTKEKSVSALSSAYSGRKQTTMTMIPSRPSARDKKKR